MVHHLKAALTYTIIYLSAVCCQQYQDYEAYGDTGGGDYYQDNAAGGDSYYGQDTLFQDFEEGKAKKEAGGGIGLPVVITSLAGWLVGGKFHSGRVVSKLKRQHHKDQKKLYQQYYDDVAKLQTSNQELTKTVNLLQKGIQELEEKLREEALQREYDEFKQPDIDGDDRISRAEFNMYIQNYLKNYPGLKPEDYPRWEDFDTDGSGYITFEEYTKQMARQVQNEQKKNTQSRSNDYKLAGVKNMLKETAYADDFDDLFENLFG